MVVLVILVVGGLLEVLFRHSETRDLLSLRTMILRRNRDVPFQTVAVVGSAPPGRLRPGAGPIRRSIGLCPAGASDSSSGRPCPSYLSAT